MLRNPAKIPANSNTEDTEEHKEKQVTGDFGNFQMADDPMIRLGGSQSPLAESCSGLWRASQSR